MSRRARARGPQHTSTAQGGATRRVRWAALFAVAAMTFTTAGGAALAESQSGEPGADAVAPASTLANTPQSGTKVLTDSHQKGSAESSGPTASAVVSGPTNAGRPDGALDSQGTVTEQHTDLTELDDTASPESSANEEQGPAEEQARTPDGPVTATLAASEAGDFNFGAIQAQMANHSGANQTGARSAQEGDYVRYGILANSSTETWAPNTGGSDGTGSSPNWWTNGKSAWVGSGTTAYSAHGTNTCRWYGGYYPCSPGIDTGGVALNTKSAIGFSPSNLTSAAPGTIFNLGRMVHRNNPISATNRYFVGNMNIKFNGATNTYNWWLNETENKHSEDTNPKNNDILKFTNQISDQTFQQNGIDYTLVVHGFTAPTSGNVCPSTVDELGDVKNEFSTVETEVTYGCLYASIEQVRSLKVIKQTEAPAGLVSPTVPRFDFTSTSTLAGSPWATDFSLTPTGVGAGGAMSKTEKFVVGQTVSITEKNPTAPWNFTSLVCVDGDNKNIGTIDGQKFTLSGHIYASTAAEVPITCTYVNTYTPPNGTLTLVKKVVNDDGGTATATEWKLKAEGPDTIEGTTGSDSVTSRSVKAGSYALSELGGPEGYDPSAWSCTGETVNDSVVTVASNAAVTCTITNNDKPATLTLVKTVNNSWNGTATAGSFTLTADGPTKVQGVSGSDTVTDQKVSAGMYTLSESAVDGYELDTDWSCNGADVSNRKVKLTNGASVTCTIVNKDKAGSLAWSKVGPDGKTALGGSEWTLTPKDPSGDPVTIVDNDSKDVDKAIGALAVEHLKWGTYTLEETKAPAGYVRSAEVHKFTIDGENLTIDLGAIRNEQHTGPSLPLTGGMGTDTFLLAGGGLLALAGIGGWIHRRRSQRLRLA